MKINQFGIFLFSTVVAAGVLPAPAFADFKLPAPSPAAEVSQQVGVTEIEVSYSSPAVKGRTIWGELVPYGEVWRTGANRCTEFSTSDPITVAGKELPAGEYCLFTVPKKGEWEVIFNKDERQFAAVDYDKSKDVLRVTAKPETSEFRERLTFMFTDVTDDSANLRLEWEKLALDLPIKTDTKRLALEKIKGLKDGSAWDYLMAARYLKDSEKNLDLALEYVNRSIAKERMWFNTFVKGDILAAKGEYAEAAKLADSALKMNDESVLYRVFADNIKKSSDEWSQKAMS